MKIKFFKKFGFLHRRAKSESAALPAGEQRLPPSLSAGALRAQIGAPYAVSDRVPYLPGPTALPPLVAVPAITLSPPAPLHAPPTITLTAPSPLPESRPLPSSTLSPPESRVLAPPIVLADPPVSPDFAALLHNFALGMPTSPLEPEQPPSPTPEAISELRSQIEELETRNADLRTTNQDLEQAIKDTTFELSAQRSEHLDTQQNLRELDEDIQRRKQTVVSRLARLRTFAQALRDLDLDKARSNPRAAPIYEAASHADLVAVLASNARAAAANPASPWAEILPIVHGEPTEAAYTRELEEALRIRRAARQARRMTKYWKQRAEACGVDVEGAVMPSLSAVSAGEGWMGEGGAVKGTDGAEEEGAVTAGPSTSTMASVADDPFRFDAPSWGLGKRGEDDIEEVERDETVRVSEVKAEDDLTGRDVAEMQVAKLGEDKQLLPSRLPLPVSPSGRSALSASTSSIAKRGRASSPSREAASSTRIPSSLSSRGRINPPSGSRPPVPPLPGSAISSTTPALLTRKAGQPLTKPKASSTTPDVSSTKPDVSALKPTLPPLASQVFREEMRASRSRERISLGSLSSARSRERMGASTSRSRERVLGSATSRERMTFPSTRSRSQSQSRTRKRRSTSAGVGRSVSAGNRSAERLPNGNSTTTGRPLSTSRSWTKGRRARSASRHAGVDEVGRKRARGEEDVAVDAGGAKEGVSRRQTSNPAGTPYRSVAHKRSASLADGRSLPVNTPSIGKPKPLASPTRRRHQSTSSQASALPEKLEKSHTPTARRDVSPMRVDIRAAHDSMLQTNSNSTRTTPASSPLDPGFPRDPITNSRDPIAVPRDPVFLAALAPPGPGLASSASAPAANVYGPMEADPLRGEYEEAPRRGQEESPRGDQEEASRKDHEEASRAKTVRALKSLERFVASLSAKTMSTLSSARSLVSLASGQSLSARGEYGEPASRSKASGARFSKVSRMKLSHSEASGLSSRPVSRLPASRSEMQHDYEGEFGVLSSNAAHFAPSRSRSRMPATRSGLSAATTAGTVSELPWRRPIGQSMTMDSSMSDAWAPSSLPGTSSAFPTTQSSTSLSTLPSRLPRLRMRTGSRASDTGRKRVISKEDISGPASLQSAAGVARLREKASAERVLRGSRSPGRASMRDASAPRMVKSASTDRVPAKTATMSVGRQHRRAEALRGEGAGAAHKRSRPLDGGVPPLPVLGSKGMSRSVTAAEMRRGGGEEFVCNRATWDADNGSL